MNSRLLTFLFIALAAVSARAFAGPDEVKTETGRVRGAVREGVVAFKGIPYAAPPVGELRWRPPQPAKDWSGVRPASEYGADCAQLPFPGDAAPLGVKPAEDCLYVNVWAPQPRPAKSLPVIVWIYGGGFVNGGSSPAVYDGSQFARRGLVFVSFNYRLGRFGFFAHPALTKENPGEPKGNYGYMDQIAALAWVKRNIAAFGGNPGNVTIFGESAGGGSVLMLMTSPMAKGLFHKAIVESGGGRGTLFPPRYLNRQERGGPPSGESVGLAFAEKAGIKGDDAAALAELRKLPADRVVNGLNMASMMNPTYAGPMVDGKVVVEPPDAAYLAGRGARVPFMIGANSADIGFPRGKTKDELFAPFGPDAGVARTLYDPDGSGKLFAVGALIASDQMMVEPARHMAGIIAATGQPAYLYRFSYVAESMRGKWQGAPHATEIPFVFDTVAARYGQDLTPADKAMAEKALSYWANFAKTGNPNGKGLPEWPAYSPSSDVILDFTANGPVAGPDPWKKRLDLAERAAERAKN
jgi:para-nitrobenzyl esterase